MKIQRLFLITALLLLFAAPLSAATPGSYDREMGKIQVLSRAGRYEEAERLLVALARRYPRNPEILAFQGRLSLWQKDYADAARLLRWSLALKENSELRRELVRVESLVTLARADRLQASGDKAAAIALLEGPFRRKLLLDETGRRLGLLYLETGKPGKAHDVFAVLRKSFPRDADYAILSVRALTEQGAPRKALAELSALPPAWQSRSDAAQLKARILAGAGDLPASGAAVAAVEVGRDTTVIQQRQRLAGILQGADRAIGAGRDREAERLLLPEFDKPEGRYQAGLRLGRIYLAEKDYPRAAAIYRTLRDAYPKERDFARLHLEALAAGGSTAEALQELERQPRPLDASLLALRGRLLYREGRLEEATESFRKALEGNPDPGLRDELARAETARVLQIAARLAEQGDPKGAENIWEGLYRSKRESYESGRNLAKAALARRDYRRARELFDELAARYPAEQDFRYQTIEARVLEGDLPGAGRIMDQLAPDAARRLKSERPDLYYRVHRNNLRVTAGYYDYSEGRSAELSSGATLTRRVGAYTGVLAAGVVRRFGLTDTQAGLELYRGLGERSARSGYLAFSFSPDAQFLPRYTAGGEFTQGLQDVDLSLGLFRLAFRESAAHLVIPGITWHLPRGFAVGERLYFVADTGAVTGLTTLSWEPDHRFKGAYSLGVGNGTERISAQEDVRRIFTLSNRLSAEYRMDVAFSVGLELSHEHRQSLYDRRGALLFGRYWW
ncbi:MAG: hypothetical protein A2075_06975 [Geobacteraceae bacterium GWC2_58_44]|nr:MAG: hypothetical protein A2075_06975 [Geobacteraceae bacterium GWC2_58_44]